MTSRNKYRVERLAKHVKLMSSHVVRESINANDIGLLEPADPRFDAPPDKGDWEWINVGDSWGYKQRWAYFRGTCVVPAGWKGGCVELRMSHKVDYLERPADDNYPAGPEGQVFIDGERAGAIDQEHRSIRWPFKPGRSYDVRAVFFAARCAVRLAVQSFGLVWVDLPTEKLYHDLRVALEVIEQLDETSVAREKMIEAVEAAVAATDVRETLGEVLIPVEEQRDPESGSFYSTVAAAQKAFDARVAEVKSTGEAPKVTAVGHAHIDLGWLWPFTQSRHKCVRTFATQCRLLEQYGDWVFFQSSAQAYAWVEQDAPDLFKRIAKLVKGGRWEADGATWCEADTNLTSGESLVRQFLVGKRYFREKFGVESRVLWMPDVFGYSAALPQLMKLAGVDGFITSKISWSQFNRFPHDTFRWRGIDGTEIPVHYITTPTSGSQYFTYNAKVTARELAENWKEYRQKHLLVNPLLTFGYGDGGGGPTELMLESGKRLASVPASTGLPALKYEKAGDLMKRICARAKDLPVWDGELYLEYHRGTYTTQGWLKRANRRNEVRLHNVEWLASLASRHGFKLNKARLDAMWRDLLLMQFHDVLPGSSVGEVYDEVRQMHQGIASEADGMIAAATEKLCAKIDTAGLEKPVVLFNTLSWDRSDPVLLPDGTWRDDVTVPACGWTLIDAAQKIEEPEGETLAVGKDARQLSNRFWKLRLDAEGRITELFDRINDRQVLAPGGKGNEWQVFEDRPLGNDAWDIDPFYEQSRLAGPKCISIKQVEKGPVRVAVELKWEMPQIGRGPQSTITQRIALYVNHPRIDFETQVEWHEHHQLLKVAFPADVRATEATFEVQFGHLRRPTHRNTLWDFAKFEVSAHRFVDVSEHGYGVSMLNDCKYGHDVHDSCLRMTCIKSPQSPHARADQGLHEFNYALLPHAGSFEEAGVVRAAAELNVPVIARTAKPSSGSLLPVFCFVQVSGDAAIIDTMKPAEDGEGIILRVYESHGSHATATLTFADAPKSVAHVNLLEERLDEEIGLVQEGNAVTFSLRPFQIASLRVKA